MVLTNTFVKSCFKTLNPWTNKFKLEDRLVWLSIEGLPPHAWHEAAFSRIARSLGDIIILETCNSTSNNQVARNVCVRTKCMNVILHTMPILVDDSHMYIRVCKIIGEDNVLLPLETSSKVTSDAGSVKSDDENDDYDDESDCDLFVEGLTKS
nr:cytochrome P450 [Tanacetum cinerariifolium]